MFTVFPPRQSRVYWGQSKRKSIHLGSFAEYDICIRHQGNPLGYTDITIDAIDLPVAANLPPWCSASLPKWSGLQYTTRGQPLGTTSTEAKEGEITYWQVNSRNSTSINGLKWHPYIFQILKKNVNGRIFFFSHRTLSNSKAYPNNSTSAGWLRNSVDNSAGFLNMSTTDNWAGETFAVGAVLCTAGSLAIPGLYH